MNNVTPDRVLSALGAPKKGRVYSLSHVLDETMPLNSFHGPFFLQTFRRLEDGLKFWGGNFSAINVRLEMTDQHGTHIDSLNHVSLGYRMYNTEDGRKITTEKGTTRLGIETMPPLISHGVLIDVARHRGTKVLPDEYQIDIGTVKEIMREEGIAEPGRGDVVLFRTGYGRLWGRDNKKFTGPPLPGIDLSVAEWAVARGVSAMGSDTQSLEHIPRTDPPTGHVEPVHQTLIVKNGIHIIENMMLEELSDDAVKEFLFVCLPLKIRGGSGSPINAVAMI